MDSLDFYQKLRIDLWKKNYAAVLKPLNFNYIWA